MKINYELLKKAAREIIKKEKVNYYSNLYQPNTLKEEEKKIIRYVYEEVKKNETE